MRERIIWTIEGVKFNKKNGKMIIPPDGLALGKNGVYYITPNVAPFDGWYDM